MRRYYTPGLRLLNFLMDAGGSLTLWQIARKSHDGRLLTHARAELEGLILEEKGKTPNRGQRSGRPCTRVFLTMRGWAACAALRRGWEPRRLPVAVLKDWLRELKDEQDPWAMSLHEMPPKQFEKVREDAKELARLKEAKWIRPPLRQRGPKPGIQPVNGFQRRDGSSPAPGQPLPPRPADRPDPRLNPARSWEGLVERPALPAANAPQVRNTSHAQLSPFEEGLRLQNIGVGSSRPPDRFVQNGHENQKPAAGEPLHEIIHRANVAGYPTRGGREVMLESVWVPATTWARAVPR
jgi:hypothetical protein